MTRMKARRFVGSVLATGMLAGLLLSGGVAAAQGEEGPDLKQYEGELYDFAIAWDGNVWGNSSSYTWEEQEQIEIESGATTLTLHAYIAGDDDLEECVEGAQERREQTEGVENVEIADDLSLPIEQDGVEGVVLTYDLEVAGRDPLAIAEYVGCTTLEEAGSILEISVRTRAGIYEEEVGIAEDVLDSLDLQ